MDRKAIEFLVFCLVIILVLNISNEKMGKVSNSEETLINKVYGYSIVDRESTNTIEEKNETLVIEEAVIDPLLDNNIDIIERIDNYLGDSKYNMGFIYYNLISEEMICFNEDMYVDAASLYKVGLNLVVYDMVEKGQITLDDLIYYHPGQFQGGTGILQYDTSFGCLPLRILLEYSIIYSDNIAATMIYEYIGGWVNFKVKLYSLLGIEYSSYENITSARIEFEILKYLYQRKDNELYGLLINDMKNTEFHDRMDKYIEYDKVAHKIGSNEAATHDIGIVFTEETYILIFITDGLYNAPDKIADISKAIYGYNKEFKREINFQLEYMKGFNNKKIYQKR